MLICVDIKTTIDMYASEDVIVSERSGRDKAMQRGYAEDATVILCKHYWRGQGENATSLPKHSRVSI